MTSIPPVAGIHVGVNIGAPTPPPPASKPIAVTGTAGKPKPPAGVNLRPALADGPTLLTAQEAAQKASESAANDSFQLSDEEKQQVAELKKRDAEVRRHEQAHAAAGGQYAGAPSYSFQRGPDGRSYAVGGSVPIDTAAIPGDPQATVRKMQRVQRAALAPADPSSQDRSIAARAASQKIQAQAEAAAERTEELRETTQGGDNDDAGDTSAPPDEIIQTVGLIA